MIHKIKSVELTDNLFVIALFTNGIEKKYDVKNIFDSFPQMKILESDIAFFKSAQLDAGGYGISWNDDLDIDSEEIWNFGVDTGRKITMSLSECFGNKFVQAREQRNMTQKDLSKLTGIAQCDISKMEKGIANPSLTTISRIADGLQVELRIDLV